jgi:hypothetical protein
MITRANTPPATESIICNFSSVREALEDTSSVLSFLSCKSLLCDRLQQEYISASYVLTVMSTDVVVELTSALLCRVEDVDGLVTASSGQITPALLSWLTQSRRPILSGCTH